MDRLIDRYSVVANFISAELRGYLFPDRTHAATLRRIVKEKLFCGLPQLPQTHTHNHTNIKVKANCLAYNYTEVENNTINIDGR